MPAKGPVALLVVLLALAVGGCGGDDDRKAASDARPATLALDFQPNAVHAGIFTAVDQGLDEREGVELTVRTPAASTDSLKLLAAGKADFSVVDIHDLGPGPRARAGRGGRGRHRPAPAGRRDRPRGRAPAA